MICYSIVGPVVSAYFVRQITAAHLLLPFSLVCSKRLRMKRRVQTFTQVLKRFHFVGSLVSTFLGLRHDSCWNVHGSASAVCFVHVLSTCALRAISVNPYFFHVKHKFSWYIWHNNDNRCARVNSAFGFSFRHSLHLMHPWLMFQVFVDVSALNKESSVFAPLSYRNVSLKVDLFEAPVHQLAIVSIHVD